MDDPRIREEGRPTRFLPKVLLRQDAGGLLSGSTPKEIFEPGAVFFLDLKGFVSLSKELEKSADDDITTFEPLSSRDRQVRSSSHPREDAFYTPQSWEFLQEQMSVTSQSSGASGGRRRSSIGGSIQYQDWASGKPQRPTVAVYPAKNQDDEEGGETKRSTGEAVRKALNSFFSEAVALIESCGGDVLKFAGDAIICAWIASEDTEEAIAEASACAISCGVRMQNELGHFDIGLGTDQQLESKITVTAGKLRLMHVGQTAKRREFVPAGEPFEDMKEFAPLTKAGRVVLSDFVARICEGSVNIVREHEVWCAESMKGEVKHKPLEVPLLSELDLDLLFRYCPPLIREMGADGELWGSEIRTVAVLFANLRLSKDMQGENLVNLAQDAFHSMLLALNAFDGALRQFLVEDKGLTLIGVWGLPFQSHHDDAARAAQAAKQMRVSLMERHSFDVGIGIAFGEAFCGSVGAPTRCEYSVTGRTVNLAARMMQQAEDSILTDSGTKNGCHNMQIGLSFLYRGLTNVKGFNYPVSTFQLVDNEDGQYRQNLRRMNVFASNIVYRQAELEQLTSTAKEVVQLGHSKLVLLTGAVYLGKSQLLANMVDELRQHGFRTVVQEDASVASTTAPLRGFQSTLENFFRMPGFFQRQEAGLTDVKTSIERISRVLEEMDTLSRDRAYQSIVQPADECAWVPEGCSFKDLAPVVARMLNMEVEENEMSKQIAQDTSASTFMKAVARNALRIMAEKGPVAIAIDNVSSMDPLSWEMLRKACEIDENLFIVVGLTEDNTRINQRAASRFERDRALSSKVTRIRLESLNREAIRGLICRRLQSKIVPRVFVDFAERLSEGSPVFCVEVVDKLFQLGIIEISDENDEVVVDAAALAMGVDQQVLPPTLAGAVRQNLDRVSSQAQLAAKACAVLGSEFDEEGASRLLDERIDVEVYRALRELQDASLIELMAGEEDNGVERSRPRRSSTVSMHENRQWQFRTATVHHCIYSTIPLELRRELHSEAAEYIERSATESGKNPMTDDRLVVVLAHHFEQGGQYARAFPLFRQAVERALDQGNYWDVTLHANSALQIAEKHMEGQLKDVANIAISLAEALYLLDEYERAEPWIEYVHTKLQGDIEPNSAETRKESAARTLSKLWCCFRADVSGSQRNSQASGAGSTSADHQEQLANGDKRPEHSNILTEAVVRQAKYMLIAGRIGRAHAALWHQAKLLKPEGNLAVLLTHCEEALSSLTCESTGQRKPTPWYSFDRNADGVPQTNLEAFRHLVLALAAWAAGDFQSALGLLESASLLAEGDKVLAGRVEAELKVVRCLIDRQDERISRGNQEAIADSMESEALANMGDLYMMQGNAVVAIIKGDLDRGMKATERFERAFEEYKPSFASERRDLGYAFSAEARMYSQREPEEAIKDALGALATLEERDFVAGFQTGAVEAIGYVLLRGLLKVKTGEVDREKRAMEYYVSRAIEQVERLLNHHSDLEPTMLTQRAIYQLHMGETKKAERWYKRAIQECKRRAWTLREVRVRHAFAHHLNGLGMEAEANANWALNACMFDDGEVSTRTFEYTALPSNLNRADTKRQGSFIA